MLGYCCDSYARSEYVLNWTETSGYFSYSVIAFRKATITILQVCFQHQNPVYQENSKYYQEETPYNNYFLWQWEILLPMPHFHEKFIQTNLKQAVFLIVTTPTTTKTYQVSDITKVSSPSAKQKFIWIFSYFYNLTKKQISKSMSTYDKIILFAYLLISLG